MSTYPDSMRRTTRDVLVEHNYMSPKNLPNSRYAHDEWATVQNDIGLPLSEVIYIKNVLFGGFLSSLESFSSDMDPVIRSKLLTKGYIDLNSLPNSRRNYIEWKAIRNDCELDSPSVFYLKNYKFPDDVSISPAGPSGGDGDQSPSTSPVMSASQQHRSKAEESDANLRDLYCGYLREFLALAPTDSGYFVVNGQRGVQIVKFMGGDEFTAATASDARLLLLVLEHYRWDVEKFLADCTLDADGEKQLTEQMMNEVGEAQRLYQFFF